MTNQTTTNQNHPIKTADWSCMPGVLGCVGDTLLQTSYRAGLIRDLCDRVQTPAGHHEGDGALRMLLVEENLPSIFDGGPLQQSDDLGSGSPPAGALDASTVFRPFLTCCRLCEFLCRILVGLPDSSLGYWFHTSFLRREFLAISSWSGSTGFRLQPLLLLSRLLSLLHRLQD